MPNIKFSYLYRDSSNYKNYNYAVFANPENLSLDQLKELLRSKLIYGEWFYANEWQLPDLFTSYFDPYTDPTWHEFESVEYTDEAINYTSVILNFFRIPQDRCRLSAWNAETSSA